MIEPTTSSPTPVTFTSIEEAIRDMRNEVIQLLAEKDEEVLRHRKQMKYIESECRKLESYVKELSNIQSDLATRISLELLQDEEIHEAFEDVEIK